MFSQIGFTLLCGLVLASTSIIGLNARFLNNTHVKIANTKSLKITPISNCEVKLDNGKVITLKSLDNPSNPFEANDPVSGYNFFYNPCSPLSCDKNTRTAMCQKSQDEKYIFDCGDQDNVQFSYDDSNGLVLQYTHTEGSGTKTTNIQCSCDTSNSFTFGRENPTNTYSAKLNSKCCCPDGCKGKGPGGGGSGGLSAGSIIVIIFISIVGAYLIFGIIFMKFVKKANGLEIIPNHGLWVQAVDNVKGGFSFSVQKVRSLNGGYSKI